MLCWQEISREISREIRDQQETFHDGNDNLHADLVPTLLEHDVRALDEPPPHSRDLHKGRAAEGVSSARLPCGQNYAARHR